MSAFIDVLRGWFIVRRYANGTLVLPLTPTMTSGFEQEPVIPGLRGERGNVRMPLASRTVFSVDWVRGPSRSGPGVVTPFRACRRPGGWVATAMRKISYDRYRFPPEIIQQAIWLYLRFTLSFRDVEDLLAEHGVMVSYESVRRRVSYFGPTIAADLRRRSAKPRRTWRLHKAYLKISGRMVYL